MKKLSLLLISFIFISKVAYASTYNSDPEIFIKELVSDAINKLSEKGMYFFDYGNAFLLEASRAKADILDANGNFKYPSYVQDIMGPMCFDYGFGPFRWVCASNKAYDLASLIDDVRLKTSYSFKEKIFKFYTKKQKNLDIKKFKNDFEILSVLRNLKIIGIFTRLALRDRKKNYLRFIPYTWQLINMRIDQNRTFIDLKNLLSQNFKKIK